MASILKEAPELEHYSTGKAFGEFPDLSRENLQRLSDRLLRAEEMGHPIEAY